jgi:hypothetical protein
MMRIRSAAVVTVLVLAVGSAAACSSSGSTGGGGGGGGSGAFKDVLNNIHAAAQTSNYIEYGDTAQLAKLNGAGAASDGPFGRLLGTGEGELAQFQQLLPPLTGFDPAAATGAVSVGSPPNTASVLYGSYDPKAVGAKLAAWGYHWQDRGNGVTAWIFQDDHKIDMGKLDPATGIGPGMGGWLNVVWVSQSSIAYGRATSDLAAALPAQSKPLSGDPMVGSLADCLGPTVVALVVTDPKQIGNSGISAIAFGVTATGTSDIREEICAAAPDAAGAQAFATGFTKAVTSGHDIATNQPWANLLSAPQTKVIGGAQHVAQLSAKPIDPQGASLVVNLVQGNDYAGLLGLPQTLKNGRTVNPDGTLGSPSLSPSSPS